MSIVVGQRWGHPLTIPVRNALLAAFLVVVALFWVANGATYVCLLFATPHWRRIVPTSWRIIPGAWAVFVHYATFHLPPEPNGFFGYNALQQLSYFAVVFVLVNLLVDISYAIINPRIRYS